MRILFFYLLVWAIAIFSVDLVAHSLLIGNAISEDNTFVMAEQFGNQSPTPGGQEINPGDVVINEIMWGGTASGSADEWIELRNTTNNDIDISGWTIENLGESNSPVITIHENKSIPANGFFVLSNYSKANSILNIDPGDVNSGISLSNSSSELLILKNGSSIIDSAGQGIGLWFAGSSTASGPAKSMERKSPPGDGMVAGNWETADSQVNLDNGVLEMSTPGEAN